MFEEHSFTPEDAKSIYDSFPIGTWGDGDEAGAKSKLLLALSGEIERLKKLHEVACQLTPGQLYQIAAIEDNEQQSAQDAVDAQKGDTSATAE
jgi:hypothetical protein